MTIDEALEELLELLNVSESAGGHMKSILDNLWNTAYIEGRIDGQRLERSYLKEEVLSGIKRSCSCREPDGDDIC